MTITLNHPLEADTKLVDIKTVEAALASLSYWSVPKAIVEEDKVEETALDQMYAYF